MWKSFSWWSAWDNPLFSNQYRWLFVWWSPCDNPLLADYFVTFLCLTLNMRQSFVCLSSVSSTFVLWVSYLSIPTFKCQHSCSSKWIIFREISARKNPDFSESSNEAFNDECWVCWPTFTKCQDPCLQTWDPRDWFGGLLNELSCLILHNSRGLLPLKVAICKEQLIHTKRSDSHHCSRIRCN